MICKELSNSVTEKNDTSRINEIIGMRTGNILTAVELIHVIACDVIEAIKEI